MLFSCLLAKDLCDRTADNAFVHTEKAEYKYVTQQMSSRKLSALNSAKCLLYTEYQSCYCRVAASPHEN